MASILADLFGALLAALGVTAGFISWRILIFKIGVFEPIMSINPFHER